MPVGEKQGGENVLLCLVPVEGGGGEKGEQRCPFTGLLDKAFSSQRLEGEVPGEQEEEEACVCMYPFVMGKRQAASKAPDLAGLGLHGSGQGAAGFGGMVVSRL